MRTCGRDGLQKIMHEQSRAEDEGRFEEDVAKELILPSWTAEDLRELERDDCSLMLKRDVPVIKRSNRNICADCGLQIRHPVRKSGFKFSCPVSNRGVDVELLLQTYSTHLVKDKF
jgi:hypothetical protein